ncbi:hypothetical protein LMG33818_000998 [Halomonadaceae bacterium LMG 33818]|uniref:NUDIX domain-containing protein n=1 Tax=Cernens ardua TaxID=3402176 RepID=UPI003EDC4237
MPIIKHKVLGLAWRGNELLLVPIDDPADGSMGARPPGGTIEFGECRETAIKREFMEEFSAMITLEGEWHTLENIFEFNGVQGHEFCSVIDITFDEKALYERDILHAVEDDGTPFQAQWCSLDSFIRGEKALYPQGLLSFLRG